ncbi:hypothetical protein A3D00_01120 [Candidatus Woesebacteria bacterium RIFCSPHIGHO2_02_FULL_38_9]|uniref:Uncharacterized protein n=1 Tax=Candidatus Woesebacteria bacterium RIFCSPHIGHO2_01_FULL_39_28 TaxID=1802496 RepID=A0A1F7YH25_9BACT|nr:MAG: hypothetical protein A2627_01275 [Candidatus Woesebacteria bacterium RIFCSPHIGHO2_01_FULL_39_28]OGM31724.1 MAG: hypothetical protein A3D00_01120 [Candidatus Woesebacteria bacterium RIFCSPHIGHO2_02_FULL_38_9]OGM57665.1 MAG: hypothetical protein A3A50_01495 [Candidatus Woesebacteria bacterium RIFCSPLOWO2_01_FULL_38_20]
MSKIFYDHLVDLEKTEKEIRKIAKTSEEREELWQLVDELLHHKVVGCILDNLPSKHHKNFLTRLDESPYDEAILDYLNEKIEDDIRVLIKKQINDFESEFLGLIYPKQREY